MRKLLIVLLLAPLGLYSIAGCGKAENKVIPLPADYDEAAETAAEEAELETTE